MSRTSILLLLFSGVLALAGANLGLGQPSNDIDLPVRQIVWHPCPSNLPAPAECGSLQVPVDYADPNGQQTTVGITRLKANGNTHSGGSR